MTVSGDTEVRWSGAQRVGGREMCRRAGNEATVLETAGGH